MKTAFHWDDAFRLDDQLSDDERACATPRASTASSGCSRAC
jgi:hypothetical protein